MPSFIDSHCHLDLVTANTNAENLLRECERAGIGGILVPGISARNWQDVEEIRSENVTVYRAYGLHPYFVSRHQERDLEVLAARIATGKCHAVGEIGLDYFRNDLDPKRQQFYFQRQLQMAAEAKLPVVLHARKSHHDVLHFLKASNFGSGGFVHAFSGSPEIAEQYIKRGFVLGFGGAITWDRATRLRGLVASLPGDSIVLETDAPDMRPSFDAERANTPLNLVGIADTIAALRGVPVADLAQETTENVLRVLNLRARN